MSIELHHSTVAIGDLSLHVVESGAPEGRPFLFLHGWPESWRTWLGVMGAAQDDARIIALDLPGVGGSTGTAGGGSKSCSRKIRANMTMRRWRGFAPSAPSWGSGM